MTSRGSWARRGAAVGGVAVLALTLTGCVRFEFENIMAQLTTTAVDCDTWSVTPTFGPMVLGPAKDPVTNEEVGFYGVARDAADVELYRSPTRSEFSFDAAKTPVVADFTAAPTLNPISTGYYATNGQTYMGVSIGHCDGLPFVAQAYLPPGHASLATVHPTFDVLFSEPVSGFDASDIELDGTAGPTGATVTLLAEDDFPASYASLPEGVGEREWHYLRGGGQIYRVTIDGVTADGTVTMRVPAGATTSLKGDATSPNAATATVTASVDANGPQISGIGDITRQLLPGETSAVVDWPAPVVHDPLSGVASSACAPASGTSFEVGDTTVTCAATDGLGNESSASFVVTVLAAQEPTVHVEAEQAGAVPQGGTARFTVTATDHTGASAPLSADDYTVTSSVETDVIDRADGAFAVTFPHASPHALTVTQVSTGATAEITVEVTPAVVPGGETPQQPEQPQRPERPQTGSAAALPETGADPAPLALAGVALAAAGALALVVRAFARRRAPRA